MDQYQSDKKRKPKGKTQNMPQINDRVARKENPNIGKVQNLPQTNDIDVRQSECRRTLPIQTNPLP
jgi:hypothetical protein